MIEDRKENLYGIAEKVILINGEHDHCVDLEFSKQFKNYTITRMGYAFFGYESKLKETIKSNIYYYCHIGVFDSGIP